MIPNSAVEAAASSQYEQRYGAGKWESCPFPDVWRDMVRPGLEAAAPHMLAEVWRSGYVSGLHNMEFNGIPTPNPYRPTP